MSQVIHTPVSMAHQIRSHRIVALSALLALFAASAVALTLAIDSGSSGSNSPVREQPQPALRSDGGPDEIVVAGSVGSRPSAVPDESRIASAVGGNTILSQVAPDESVVAASLSRAPEQQQSTGPDESRIAASLSGR